MTDEVPCVICGVRSSYLTPVGDLCEAHAVVETPGFVVVCNRLGTPEPTEDRWGTTPTTTR
ncbi:hypothetical protein M197_gp75 [Haloarcula hispanica tailed virus 2]|uniref:Uncharacterized protein n=1 Tax=Haloarcula hispanica tailed virus 2 TaxID=1273751 RepID=R4T6C1_9CAUD|nr:hypothetical protein M197_gp75 [Haloarcula hispanica tailed virus 2]AGM11239.1 hypothetical protein HHTV2_75 [Haloarcula hispanica tailed virus 2]